MRAARWLIHKMKSAKKPVLWKIVGLITVHVLLTRSLPGFSKLR